MTEKQANILVWTLMFMIVFMSCVTGAYQDIELNGVKTLGSGEAEAVREYVSEQEGIASGTISPDDIEYIGEIVGHKIPKSAFMVRYFTMRRGGGDITDLPDRVWDSLKRDIWDRSFARKRGLTPTMDELDSYVADLRRETEQDAKAEKRLRAFAEGLGMTYDEYWEYVRKYEAPEKLERRKVDEFLRKVGLPQTDLRLMHSEITDEESFKSLFLQDEKGCI